MVRVQGFVCALALGWGVLPASAPAASGAELFQGQCKMCHSTPMAPALNGVIGRPVASVSGFRYSDALKAKAGQKWTPALLDAFLANPARFAPGTRMPIAVADADDRAAIIAFLKTQK